MKLSMRNVHVCWEDPKFLFQSKKVMYKKKSKKIFLEINQKNLFSVKIMIIKKTLMDLFIKIKWAK